MDFSEPISFTGTHPTYSPTGYYIACTQSQLVVIREVESLQMVRLISCLEKVQRVDWSADSKYLLCSLPNRAQVFSLDDHEWMQKIDEGSAGVRNCIWAPDGCSILVVADFQIRISVYSLLDHSVKLMRGPKYPDKGISFSPDGQLLAYAERTDCKEYVSLVSADSWELRMRIATTTQDLADLAWSPDSSCFVVWDTLLTYKLLIYSSSGHCLASFSAYQDALGIRTVQWSSDGRMLAVGSYDQEVRILSSSNWRPISARLEHSASIREDKRMVIYTETNESGRAHSGNSSCKTRYIVSETPLKISSNKAPAEKPNPRIGVAHVQWSADGRYLACRNESMPSTVFLWSMEQLDSPLCSVVVQAAPVRSCHWNPERTQLVIATGSNKVFLWSPDGASCVHVPVPAFNVNFAHWSPLGNTLLLADREYFCCAYTMQE